MKRQKPYKPRKPSRQQSILTAPENAAFNPDIHCGVWSTKRGRRIRCLALKGEGGPTPGFGPCRDHITSKRPVNPYLSIRPTRLHYLLQRVQANDSGPTDILKELEILRALSIAFIEDNPELKDPEVILQASDLLSKIMKGAQLYQQIQQSETLHIKSVELLTVQMAEIMMRMILSVDPQSTPDWRDRLIDRIKNQWGAISIERDVKKLKPINVGVGSTINTREGEEEEFSNG